MVKRYDHRHLLMIRRKAKRRVRIVNKFSEYINYLPLIVAIPATIILLFHFF